MVECLDREGPLERHIFQQEQDGTTQ